MALTLMLVLPAAVGAWLVAGGRVLGLPAARLLALVTAVLTLAAAVFVTVQRPVVRRAWVPDLDVGWHFAVDGISIPLVLLTAVIGVLVTAHAWVELPGGGVASTYLGCLLLVEAGALATFTARDAILFFVAFEVVLVPMWVLISRFGDQHAAQARRAAGLRFILYTALGSTLMLVGILVLVTAAGTGDLDRIAVTGAQLPRGVQVTAAVFLVLGLAVKVPVFPFHTWLPPAHTTAPTAGSVLLAAVLLKMGTYGLVRLPVASVPAGVQALAQPLAIAGAIGVVWGGLVCLVERDLKRLIAYSSVAHMGFVVLGIASGTSTGLQSALFANIAHGIVAALLFVIVGGLKQRWGSVDLAVVRPALREVAPGMGFVFIFGLTATLGLPGLVGFWGEFLAVYAGWSPLGDRAVVRVAAVVAVAGAALAAAYALRVARLVWVGDGVPEVDQEAARVATPDTRGVEAWVLAVLVAATVVLGVAPGLLLSVTSDAATALLGPAVGG